VDAQKDKKLACTWVKLGLMMGFAEAVGEETSSTSELDSADASLHFPCSQEKMAYGIQWKF
jgi:hypothetical protein